MHKIASLILALGSSSLLLANANTNNKDFFSVNGNLGLFNKVGFNTVKINKDIGKYPTESFSALFGKIDTEYNFLAFMDSESINKLNIGLGVSAGALVFDSTKKDASPLSSGGLSSGSGLNNNYVGGWGGYFADGYPYKNNRNYVIQNAFLNLDSKYVNFIVGRYESDMDYYSGYTEGFNIDTHFKYGDKKDNDFKLWAFGSWGRAFAYSQWLLDFYAPKATKTSSGKMVNKGIYAIGFDLNYGEINESSPYVKVGENILFRPFVYFYPTLYEAPGIKLQYNKQFGDGFGITTTLQGFFLHVHPAYTTKRDSTAKRYDSRVDEYSGNINLIVKANIMNYNARVGYYQNIGSGNSHFGTYGNPIGFDFWDASVYDIGASISDVINRNAITGYVSGGGEHQLEYGAFSWDLLGRITRSPRSDEESVVLNLKHIFANNIALGLTLEWFRDTTKTGYNPGANIGGSILTSKRTDDRSYMFATFDYNF